MAFPLGATLSDFNQPDGSLPADWVSPSMGDANTITVIGNAAGMASAGAGGASSKRIWGPDVDLEVVFSVIPTGSFSIYFRMSAANLSGNAYLLRYTPSTTTLELRKVVAGGGSANVANFSTTLSLANGDRIGISSRARLFQGFKNGAQVGSDVTDSSLPIIPGFFGLEFTDTAIRVDTVNGVDLGYRPLAPTFPAYQVPPLAPIIGTPPPAGTVYNDSGTGTLTLAGSGSESETHISSPTGTLTLAGTSAESFSHSQGASASLALSGLSTESETHSASRSGALALAGVADESVGVPPPKWSPFLDDGAGRGGNELWLDLDRRLERPPKKRRRR